MSPSPNVPAHHFAWDNCWSHLRLNSATKAIAPQIPISEKTKFGTSRTASRPMAGHHPHVLDPGAPKQINGPLQGRHAVQDEERLELAHP
jgi:hypothetical protein